MWDSENLEEVYLHGNPLVCNISLCWLKMWNITKESPDIKIDEIKIKGNGDVKSINGININNDADIIGAVTTCDSPDHLKGRPLILPEQLRGRTLDAVSPTDMDCHLGNV